MAIYRVASPAAFGCAEVVVPAGLEGAPAGLVGATFGTPAAPGATPFGGAIVFGADDVVDLPDAAVVPGAAVVAGLLTVPVADFGTVAAAVPGAAGFEIAPDAGGLIPTEVGTRWVAPCAGGFNGAFCNADGAVEGFGLAAFSAEAFC
jgi:hypothetical protein